MLLAATVSLVIVAHYLSNKLTRFERDQKWVDEIIRKALMETETI